jgi:transcriptional regulator with XRE-family HTH domain
MSDTYETILSELDLKIIQQVKLLRDSHELSQRDLSMKMGLSESFVGKVESLSQPDI